MTAEALHLRASPGPCEVHAWPTEGMATRLMDAMRERHGKGGINACVPCISRAKAAAALGVIMAALRAHRIRFNREVELQAGVAELLRRAGLQVERERSLGEAGRIDVFAAGVGIEVKVAGSSEAVQRQCERYCTSNDVHALVLVTSRWQGSRMPDTMSGKPVRVHVIARGLGG